MKALIFSIALIFTLNVAIVQTGNKSSSKQNTINQQKGKKQPADRKPGTNVPAKRKAPGNRNSEGPEAPYSREKSTPKDQSGKDSNKIGDSPKQ